MPRQPETKVWHPEIHAHYGRRLYFITIATETFRQELRNDLLAVVPQLSVYEIYGRADFLLRLYSTEELLNRLRKWLSEALALWAHASYFTVDRIYRIWGYDVPAPAFDIKAIDSKALTEIVDTWPALADAAKTRGFLLGDRTPLGQSEIRAFIAIQLHNSSHQDELTNFIAKIFRSHALKPLIHGIYEGRPGIGIEGHVLLEVSVPQYSGLRDLLHDLYNLAFPPSIKTTTFLVSVQDEVGDLTDFSETPDLLLRVHFSKFPELRQVPPDKVLTKMLSIDPLRPWWNHPSPIGKWCDDIAAGIIAEDEERLIGPIAEISRRLERELKSTLIQWAQQQFGDNWSDEVQREAALKDPLPRATLGQLIYAARKLADRVNLTIPRPVLEPFVEARNAIIHDEDPGRPRKPIDFGELQRMLPSVLAALFRSSAHVFSDRPRVQYLS